MWPIKFLRRCRGMSVAIDIDSKYFDSILDICSFVLSFLFYFIMLL